MSVSLSHDDLSPRWQDAVSCAVLAVLGVAFLWKMAFTNLILPRGDTLTYFYPYWAYRGEALRAGRVPLWNPLLFMGVPFLANSQAGVLYPPNWLLLGLSAPAAVKVAVISHVIWAAIGMYLFVRRRLQMTVIGATLSGAVFALGGYLTAQIEHVNQLQGLAWMPWLFWLGTRAIREGIDRRRALLWLALALAMQLLAGHTQSAFVSGIGLGVWTVWEAVARWQRERARRHSLLWPLSLLGAAALLALALTAAQLLPTLELARLSRRGGGLPFMEAVSFSLKPALVGRALLPGYSAAGPLFSEYVAHVGIVALVLAAMGIWARCRDRDVLGLALVAGGGVFLAFGAYNPVYWGLVRFVPGFALFRAPARWLALWSFGVAALAGIGLDWIMMPPRSGKPSRMGFRWILPSVVVLALIGLSFLAPLVGADEQGATRPTGVELLVWLLTLGITLAVLVLSQTNGFAGYVPTIMLILSVVELFTAGWALPYNRLSTPEAWYGQRPAISTLLVAGEGRTPPERFLSISDIFFDPGDLREIQAIYDPYLSDDALYDYVIAVKQKEIVAPNLPLAWGIPAVDGFDGGILPTSQYVEFTARSIDQGAVSPDGRLRENLDAVPNNRGLSLANVRWIITDKVYDAWVEGVLYDLQFATRVGQSSGELCTPPLPQFEATAIGLISHLEGGADIEQGTLVGEVIVHFDDASTATFSVHAGVETADMGWTTTTAHNQAPVAGQFTSGRPDLTDYVARLSWGEPRIPERICVEHGAGLLVVRGLSLVDERVGVFQSVVLSGTGHYHLIHSGDVKIYENLDVLPRAFVIEDGSFVLVDGQLQLSNLDSVRPAEIKTYTPERVVIWAESGAGGYLILTDASYPGWQAEVDGTSSEIKLAEGLFRAVRLPPGRHEIILTYRCRPFEIGAIISGVSLAIVLIGLLAPRRKK